MSNVSMSNGGDITFTRTHTHIYSKLSLEVYSIKQSKTHFPIHDLRFILRNYIAQNAIKAAEDGDFSEVQRVLKLLEQPYSDAGEVTSMEKPTNDGASTSTQEEVAGQFYSLHVSRMLVQVDISIFEKNVILNSINEVSVRASFRISFIMAKYKYIHIFGPEIAAFWRFGKELVRWILVINTG